MTMKKVNDVNLDIFACIDFVDCEELDNLAWIEICLSRFTQQYVPQYKLFQVVYIIEKRENLYVYCRQ